MAAHPLTATRRLAEALITTMRRWWIWHLLKGPHAEALFGQDEVLVPAKSLINDRDIRPHPGGEIEYFHILLDEHEIIFANGARAESLYLGDQALKGLPPSDREEVLTLFPELEAQLSSGNRLKGARPFASVRQGREIAGSINRSR